MKRACTLALSALLTLLLCVTLLPKTAKAATASRVTLFDGTTPIVLSASNRSHAFGTGRAVFDETTGTLELHSLTLTGAGNTGVSSIYSMIYASGDLVIKLNGTNSFTMPTRDTAVATAFGRGIFVRGGSLTFTGSGSLSVQMGSGYDNVSCAINCNSADTKLTVGSGVALTVNAANVEYGIQTPWLENHGKVTVTGKNVGILISYNGGGQPRTSVSDGWLVATASTESALVMGSFVTLQVNGGMVTLTSVAANMPAIGDTGVSPGTFSIGPAIANGLLGTNKATATVRSAADIMASYASTSPVYSYLQLPAASGGGFVEGEVGPGVPRTGDATPLVLLCGLVLLSGAGLAMRARRRRRG